MPLYEYCCTQCGHRYEKIQKFNSEPEAACPKCGGGLERPLTAPALQFKGAGWYVNDYAPKGGAPKGGTSSSEKPAGGGSGGSDAKPSTDPKPAAESKPAASGSTAKPAATTNTSSTTS